MKNFDFGKLLPLDLGSIVMIVLGGILLFNPDFGSAALSGILGWCLVAAGAFGLLVSILSKPRLEAAILPSALALMLGIYVLKNPLALAKVLGYALGILLLSQGLPGFLEAKKVQKMGGPYLGSLFLSCAMSVIGLRLILKPLTTSRLVMTLVGAFLIACGIVNIIQHRKALRLLEEYDYDPNIIDADN